MSNMEKIEQQNAPKMLSERSFGLIFAGIFCVVAFYPLFFNGSVRQWALIIVGLFAVPALISPVVLRPLNIAWVRFGQLMHKIINPVLMGVVFFIAVLPTGLVIRLLGKDPMSRQFDANANSYWIEREQKSISKESFDNQF